MTRTEAPAAAQWVMAHVMPWTLWLFRLFGTVTSSAPKSGKLLADMLQATGTEHGGKYVLLDRIKPSSAESYDLQKQDDLWDWTVDQLALSPLEKDQFMRG